MVPRPIIPEVSATLASYSSNNPVIDHRASVPKPAVPGRHPRIPPPKSPRNRNKPRPRSIFPVSGSAAVGDETSDVDEEEDTSSDTDADSESWPSRRSFIPRRHIKKLIKIGMKHAKDDDKAEDVNIFDFTVDEDRGYLANLPKLRRKPVITDFLRFFAKNEGIPVAFPKPRRAARTRKKRTEPVEQIQKSRARSAFDVDFLDSPVPKRCRYFSDKVPEFGGTPSQKTSSSRREYSPKVRNLSPQKTPNKMKALMQMHWADRHEPITCPKEFCLSCGGNSGRKTLQKR